jgi:hypothetical protein
VIEELGAELDRVMQQCSDDFNGIELARYFVKVRQIKDRLEAAVKPFDAFYEELAKVRIPQVFDREGVPSITLDEGFRVTVSHKLHASIKAGQKELAHQWLKDNGLGDIVSETVNASTLAGVARTMAEENQELPESLFNQAVVANTSFNKTGKK